MKEERGLTLNTDPSWREDLVPVCSHFRGPLEHGLEKTQHTRDLKHLLNRMLTED